MFDVSELAALHDARGHNVREIMVSKTGVTGLDEYTCNVGYKTGSITNEFETKAFSYDFYQAFAGAYAGCVPA